MRCGPAAQTAAQRGTNALLRGYMEAHKSRDPPHRRALGDGAVSAAAKTLNRSIGHATGCAVCPAHRVRRALRHPRLREARASAPARHRRVSRHPWAGHDSWRCPVRGPMAARARLCQSFAERVSSCCPSLPLGAPETMGAAVRRPSEDAVVGMAVAVPGLATCTESAGRTPPVLTPDFWEPCERKQRFCASVTVLIRGTSTAGCLHWSVEART